MVVGRRAGGGEGGSRWRSGHKDNTTGTQWKSVVGFANDFSRVSIIYLFTQLSTHIHTHIHTYTHSRRNTHTNAHIHIQMHIHIYTYTQTCSPSGNIILQRERYILVASHLTLSRAVTQYLAATAIRKPFCLSKQLTFL